MAVLSRERIVALIGPAQAREWDCDVACCNSRDQIVLAGTSAALARAVLAANSLVGGAVDVVALDVSAPFHCRQQATTADALRAALFGIAELLHPERASRTTCNATGGFHCAELVGLVEALALQVSCTVRWSDNMRALCDVSDRIYEVGPSRPLSRLFASLGRKTIAITSLRAARKESFS
jgi:malonyl CoA-acyl carrier protein transacylase